ncbi:aromatic amino acid ammonia-lyase [Lentzea flaviverrucosa]|uniref:Histidine ammonia-lyase/tyrosine ammonia-lyase n=1 Tax=Lentzea flaviverrucosa TaxID=200379 RepID=A0A1H9ADH9_9PSEU|nr:aromatic amino acid ammonia-lyase [Lentzea flaviverrucosa]RDI32099.1 histidine ammonia-lyase/tyrosine ammonia-lyase [Lentzea flaviverrucosa]SEP74493.1 histidine ammonia-lyase/tyrosine ammonia-lyase [Lentzea flaviverrucosa]
MTTTASDTSVDLGSPLTVPHLQRASGPLPVLVGADVLDRVERGRAYLRTVLADDERPVYGAKTGFGALVGFAGRSSEADQCDNTLAHLGAGQGPDLPLDIARASLLVRTWSLAQGLSGVSAHVVEGLSAMFATTFVPAIPRYGSVGASGDLIPLAYAAQALRGRGHAYLDGVRRPAADALSSAGLSPLQLDGRDALALVNGTSVTTAALALALSSVRASHVALTDLTCLLVDVVGADPGFTDPRLISAFGHPGAVTVAGWMRSMLGGTTPSGLRALQEPYSIRCAPQLLGAAEDALRYADSVVAADLGGVSDNPLFFPEDDLIAHGGNFFGQPAAFAADVVAMVTASLGNLAERQLDLLVDPVRNTGLPPMLAAGPGQQHGLQGVQLATTAFVAEIRRGVLPASTQSLPTNLHNQDVVPFGTQAALRAYDLAELLRLLCGSLALGLRQAVHVGGRRPTAPRCAALLDALASAIEPVDPDRPLDEDVRVAAEVVVSRQW